MLRFLRRRFAAALVLSLLVHAILGLFFHPRPPIEAEKMSVMVGRIVLERRPKPPPPRRRLARAAAVAPKHAVPYVLSAPRPRVEEAHITPRALAYQPRDTHSHARVQSVLPQVDFSKTIARLRAENDPVAGAATDTVDVSAHTAHYTPNYSESIGSQWEAYGYLEPVSSWHDGGYDYYYVRYEVTYADGTSETGVVPWPIRYDPHADPFLQGIHHMPLPLPLPDWAPPAGTQMHPLVKYCYEHRDEVSSCPIAHD